MNDSDITRPISILDSSSRIRSKLTTRFIDPSPFLIQTKEQGKYYSGADYLWLTKSCTERNPESNTYCCAWRQWRERAKYARSISFNAWSDMKSWRLGYGHSSCLIKVQMQELRWNLWRTQLSRRMETSRRPHNFQNPQEVADQMAQKLPLYLCFEHYFAEFF